MRQFINIVETTQSLHPTPYELSVAIKRKSAEIIAGGYSPSEYLINSGMCETLAEEVVDSFGGDSKELFTIWGDSLTAEGPDGFADGETWDVELLKRISPNTKPIHGLDWDDLNGHIPNHCWIILHGRNYDAECPEGVDNLFDMPICRRMIRDILIHNAAKDTASDRILDAIEQLDAQVDDLTNNWVPFATAEEVSKVMGTFVTKRAALVARLV